MTTLASAALALVTGVGLLTTSSAAFAQTPSADPPVVVTVGEGIVKRVPDRAWVSVAAESRARTTAEAQKQNADAMSSVLERLKGIGVAPDAIRTVSYELHPEFDWVNNRQTLRGYLARNAIEVRVDDLTRLGNVLDMVVGAGATSVGGIRFDLKDRTGAQKEALQRAVADARAQADAAAQAAGMKVERIVRIEVQRDAVMPPPRPMAMRAEMGVSAEPPMSPGELEVRATVTLSAAIR